MTARTRHERSDGASASAPRQAVVVAPPLAAVAGTEPPGNAKAHAGGGSAAGSPDALADLQARCAQLEDENRRLKLLVADLSLRNEALKLVVAKKW